MKTQTQAIRNDISQLAEDASALMAATADVAGERVGEARKRLTKALDQAKHIYGRVWEKEAEGIEATDEAMHRHPYSTIAIGLGIASLVALLITRRCSCSHR